MKVLLTGGTGFVGNRLGQALTKLNHEVVTLTRSPQKAERNLSYPCALYQWDGSSEAPPTEALKDIEAVFNLSGEGIADKRWTKQRKSILESSRVTSTQNLVRSLENSKTLKVFISVSGIGYYGDRGDEVLMENSSKGEGFVSDLCERWEDAGSKILEENLQVRLVTPRFGVILDSNRGFLKRLEPIFRQGFGGRLGSGHQYLSWIHIDDVISFLIRSLEDESVRGVYNLVAPEPVTNKEMTKALAKVLGVKAFAIIPAFALRIVFGEMAEVLLGSQRCRSKRLNDSNFKFPNFTQALMSLYDSKRSIL